MASSNPGKGWEDTFRKLAEISGISCVRFHDTMYDYKNVSNPADFVISKEKRLPSLLIECKEVEKRSFKLRFKQLEDLLKLTNFQSYVVIWFSSYKVVVALTPEQVQGLLAKGRKSMGPEDLLKVGINLCNSYNRIKPKTLLFEKLWDFMN